MSRYKSKTGRTAKEITKTIEKAANLKKANQKLTYQQALNIAKGVK